MSYIYNMTIKEFAWYISNLDRPLNQEEVDRCIRIVKYFGLDNNAFEQ